MSARSDGDAPIANAIFECVWDRPWRMVGLEVKTENGTQSSEQIQFQAQCIRNGGDYYVVCSINDVQALGL